MIPTNIFLDLCLKKGFDLFSGTPCSYLKPLINAVIDHPEIDYLQATNEGDAAPNASRVKGISMAESLQRWCTRVYTSSYQLATKTLVEKLARRPSQNVCNIPIAIDAEHWPSHLGDGGEDPAAVPANLGVEAPPSAAMERAR